MKKSYLMIAGLFLLQLNVFAQTTVTNLNAFYRDGQVFVTWDNLTVTGVRYNLYKSPDPIHYGFQLASAQNLGLVRDNSARNLRLTNILLTGTRYFKIDSAGTPLPNTKGLFVATSTEEGSFYYTVTTSVGGIEDTTIIYSENSLSVPVAETVAIPRPVWQETASVTGRVFEIYVQFVSKVTSSIYPQMTNEGSFAFHFAINKNGFVSQDHPVIFYMRPSGRNFLEYIWGIDDPNEYVVTIDDWLPNGNQLASLYYGYHEDFDIFSNSNPIPTSGTIFKYTAARVEFTVNWCLNNLPVDTTKVYMTGWSMGGIGNVVNFIMVPEKIAAIFISAPEFNMATSPFSYANQLWGTLATNLPTNEDYTRNERLNSCYMITEKKNTSIPVMYTFCGKNDVNVGWTEKIAFYDSMNNSNHGGFHFWSQTDHQNVYTQWVPNFPNFHFLIRYSTNVSYPAFSNCSFNDNPGNGSPTNGDPIGSINGYLDWTDDIIDSTDRWEVNLFVHDLITTQGTLAAPDSGTTDITLRRLQEFSVSVGETVFWENYQNNLLVQQGFFTYTGNLITIPEVKVYKDSSHLKVFTLNTFQLAVEIANGWNMVSIPGLHPTDQNVDTWWAFRDQGANVFRYAGGYQTVTDAVPGTGYWMKHSGARTYNTGDEWPAGGIQIVPHAPLTAASGWNLFGGYELSVTAANVTTNPPGLQSGPIYKYSGGYSPATTLDPGFGYWIKLTGAGQIIIPETMAKGEVVEYFPEDWGRIVLTDAAGRSYTLYAANIEVDLNLYELPPAPPAGMFDIRYSSGRIAEDLNNTQAIEMSGVVYPLKVKVENMDIRLQDETGKILNVNMKDGENVIIDNSTITKLMVSGELIPSTYSLSQNYPNPFNPTTKIQYSIREKQFVTLVIYDILGSKVVTLVNEEKTAGKYEVEFDGITLPSGVYFYQLKAGSFVETKKMLLLK
ncbi:MAG: T9SS type A sorting domain-containing protein [bacterium]|nr:T9SS type A sorting domain-containing protein [bacterium]